MPLVRISAQPSKTLKEFYTEVAAHTESSSLGEGMLKLVTYLDANLPLTVWALTSCYSLWLIASNDWKSEWHVEAICLHGEGYRIRHRVPESLAPWKDAFIEGIAKDEKQALEYILIAMEKTGAWTPQKSD